MEESATNKKDGASISLNENDEFVRENEIEIIIDKNVGKPDKWVAIEDMPIIFVNDDIPNTLNGHEVEHLNHEQKILEQRKEETNETADLNKSEGRIKKEANETEGVNAIEFTNDELMTFKPKEFETVEQAEGAPKPSVDNEPMKLPKKNENCDKENVPVEIDKTDIKRQVTKAESKKAVLTNNDNSTSNIEGASQFKETKIKILEDVKLNVLATCLFYPKPLSTSRKRKEADPQPSAISPKYREYLRNKATKKNSTERQGKKQTKEKGTNNKNCRVKGDDGNVTKTKENCWSCKEDLDSDVDEGDFEHVGCDNCPRWFHLKCTGLSDRSVFELKDEYFKCDFC